MMENIGLPPMMIYKKRRGYNIIKKSLQTQYEYQFYNTVYMVLSAYVKFKITHEKRTKAS